MGQKWVRNTLCKRANSDPGMVTPLREGCGRLRAAPHYPPSPLQEPQLLSPAFNGSRAGSTSRFLRRHGGGGGLRGCHPPCPTTPMALGTPFGMHYNLAMISATFI